MAFANFVQFRNVPKRFLHIRVFYGILTLEREGSMISLTEGMRYLVDERKIISGVSVACGNAEKAEKRTYGRAQDVLFDGARFVPAPRPLAGNAIFDLASVTKLFTCLSVLMLMEAGRLSLDDPIEKYEPRFAGMRGTKLSAILSFHAPAKTAVRIDAQDTRENALSALFTLSPAQPEESRYYTDMGALALKYVVEAAAGQPYYAFLKENILSPLGMRETLAHVPEALLPRAVCYNYERRIVGRKYLLDLDCPPGTPHDPKARILSRDGSDLCGHAGLFSTMDDMILLAKGLLAGKLLSRNTLLTIGLNRTSRRLPDGHYSQCLGYLCFSKHREQVYSEVPARFSERTIAENGFTGNHFSVDPLRNEFMIILANKIHNRITMAAPHSDPDDPYRTLPWDDGHEYVVSQNYTYLKDTYLKEPIAALLDGLE